MKKEFFNFNLVTYIKSRLPNVFVEAKMKGDLYYFELDNTDEVKQVIKDYYDNEEIQEFVRTYGFIKGIVNTARKSAK